MISPLIFVMQSQETIATRLYRYLDFTDTLLLGCCSHFLTDSGNKYFSLLLREFIRTQEFRNPTNARRHTLGRMVGKRSLLLLADVVHFLVMGGNPADVAYGAAFVGHTKLCDSLVLQYPNIPDPFGITPFVVR